MKKAIPLSPINLAIKKYAEEKTARFHTAGHSGTAFCDSEIEYIKKLYSFCPFDITELSFSDNLLYPTSIIAESEKLIAKIYGSKRSFYVTSGTTTSIQCVLLALFKKNRTVLLTKNNHISVFNALELFRIAHVIIDREDIQTIATAIDNNQKYSLFLTSPNYFGQINKDKALFDYCKKHDIYIVADEAHGSHFAFMDVSLSLIGVADVVLHSAHKTLPALCGSAFIHVCNEELISIIEKTHRMIHSTSPSYIAMATAEYSAVYMHENGKRLYSETKDKIFNFATKMATLTQFTLVPTDDKTRLVVSHVVGNCTEIARTLELDGVFAEMTTADKIVFIVTPFNADCLDKLFVTLESYEKSNNYNVLFENENNSNDLLFENENNGNDVLFKNENNSNDVLSEKSHSHNMISHEKSNNQNMLSDKKIAEVISLIGTKCRENIIIYPPSTPVAFKGEIITDEMAKKIIDEYDKVLGLRECLSEINVDDD